MSSFYIEALSTVSSFQPTITKLFDRNLFNMPGAQPGRVITINEDNDLVFRQTSEVISSLPTTGEKVEPGIGFGTWRVLGSVNYEGTSVELIGSIAVAILSAQLGPVGNTSQFRVWDFTNNTELTTPITVPFTVPAGNKETFKVPILMDRLSTGPSTIEFQLRNPLGNPSGVVTAYSFSILFGA